jgi:tetratricopeptide (TPR) repeat protein
VVGVFVAVFGVLTGAVGFVPDLRELWPDGGPPKLDGSVNIVIAEIALDTAEKKGRDEAVAHRFSNKLFAFVQSEITKAGHIEVGRSADQDVGVYRTEQERAERLRRDLASRDGHIAISGTLVPGIVSRLRVEIYLDRNKLDEAYQLGGLQPLVGKEFGDIATNPAAQKLAQDFLLEKARIYTDLIVAVGEYGTEGRRGLDRSLRTMHALLPKLTDPAERSFGWLLIGNAEARARRQEKAIHAYRKALDSDPASVRARLGLAEIDYLRAGGSFSEGMCTPQVSRLPTLRKLESSYQALIARLGNDQHDLRPRAEFALARTRLCVLLVRGKGPIDQIEAGFRAAAATLEQDGGKTWLRTLTADAYAMLGATSLLPLQDRPPDRARARRYYQAAAETTPDASRRAMYERRRDQIAATRSH